jgi:putative ABC transport system permease protein
MTWPDFPASEWWFRILVLLYPPDFRDEFGDGFVETYHERLREAARQRGRIGILITWIIALLDSVRNGLGERVRPSVAWRRAGNWGRDIELATRRLVRAPGFALAVLGTLTIGLGAFAIVYTVVQKILIDPMPYRDPDDLYFVWRDYTAFFDLNRGWLAGPDVTELKEAGGVIQDVASLQRVLFTFAAKGMDPAEIPVMVTSPNVLDLLGVQPALGRGFAPDEVGPGRAPVIVLTDALWRRLGGARSIIGSEVRLNGQPYGVIGVMPPGFTLMRNASLGPPQRADAYVTHPFDLAQQSPNNGTYGGLIRARHGTSADVVNSAVAGVGRSLERRYNNLRGLKWYAVGLKPDLVASIRPALIAVGFAGIFLILVLAMNLSSLLLARTARREHEFGISRALGANSTAIVRTTMVEGGLLGLVGGTAALVAAIWGTRTLMALAPADLPRVDAVAVDWRVSAVIVGTGVVVGLFGAVGPATWAMRTSLTSLLAASAVRGGRGHNRMRRATVIAQVALSLVLLSAGGLVVRSLERLLQSDPGFRAEGVLTMRVPMPPQLVPDPADVLALQQRVQEAVARIPGVLQVSAADALPLTGGANNSGDISIPGAPGNTGDRRHDSLLVDFIGARAGYFDVMGIRLLAGRGFEEARHGDVLEAVIDRHLAEQFFPRGTPLGATIPFRNKSLTIIGVVDQARLYDVHQDGRPQLYVRAEDWGYRTLSFVLRSQRYPDTLGGEVHAAIHRVDPRLAVADVRSMTHIVGDALRQQRISAVLIAGFALGALLLAAIGLFGVVSGSIARRHHELAVRLALGAEHGRLLRVVLAEGAVLVGTGVLIGLPGVYAAGGVIGGALVGISTTDPTTLLVVALGLMFVTMAACYLPARRVLRIEPSRLLKQD